MPASQFRATIDMKRVTAALARTKRALSKSHIREEMRKVADMVLVEVVAATPRRFTGNTKHGWQVIGYGTVGWTVRNKYRAMRYLEDGTRAHGPKRARRMFIPLTKRAHSAGPKGVFRNSKNFKRGKDYILAKRVKGIKAHHIVRNAAVKARVIAEMRFDRMVRKSL